MTFVAYRQECTRAAVRSTVASRCS